MFIICVTAFITCFPRDDVHKNNATENNVVIKRQEATLVSWKWFFQKPIILYVYILYNERDFEKYLEIASVTMFSEAY